MVNGTVRSWVVAAVVVVAVTGCGGGAADPTGGAAPAPTVTRSATPPPEPAETSTPPAASPTAAPQVPAALRFDATTIDGQAYDAAKLAGKPTALWFWAPWCPICRGEAPTVRELAAKHKDAVNFVGVAGLDELDAMREFVADNDVSTVTHLADEKGAVWKHFEITSQSSWVLLDANGKEVARGRMDRDELTKRVDELAG